MGTFSRGRAVIGSLEEVTIVMSRISFGERSSKRTSLRRESTPVCIVMASKVEMMPKKTMLRKCWKNCGFLIE